jgi:hypothetical protein
MLWNANCTHLRRQKFRTSTWAPNQPAREGSRNAGLTVIYMMGFTYDWIFNATGLNVSLLYASLPAPVCTIVLVFFGLS